jgi:ribose 5-phosphate isomerase B
MASQRPVLIAADHAGVELKSTLKKSIPEQPWEDLGPQTSDRVDYPDFAEKLATKISSGEYERGILICGSGIGMCIAANKFAGVRAAVVESEEAAKLSREHNDANVLCLGARLMTPEKAAKIAKTWLSTAFSAEPRHSERVRKIGALERKR